ncbi:STN and carboxypeptidase regulatory-like domain-containing protein [Niabella aquatica]
MKKYCILLPLLIISYLLPAQNALLQRVVSVDFRNITMYDALTQIENRAAVYFSYDNQFIKNQKRISFSASNKTVKEVLDMILDNEYQYIVNNNKIVIRKKEQEYMVVQGLFTDNTDQKPIEYVTVYEPELKIGTMSNEQGHFSIKVPIPISNTIKLVANRISYYDTTFMVDSKGNHPLQIGLTPRVTTEEAITIRSVERHWLAKSLISTRQKFNSLNLKSYFYQRKFQLGFWPGIGTKSALKGQQENKLSFNVFGGYAAQVDALEIGGLFNIVQKHVRSVQIGGLFNIVGGTVNGVQIGGLYNDVGDTMTGLQIGGLANINKSSTRGLQIGGLYNKNQEFTGLQIAGLINNSGNIDKGMQLSGLVNRTAAFKKGFQLSGLVNGTGNINGAQVTGLLNIAKKINGFQLGVFNIADTLNGVAVGPFNYSRNGKHSLSVSVQENNQLNISYKSGSYALYNILQAGIINTGATGRHYIFGYGLGSEWALKRKLKMAAELIHLYYTPADHFNTDYSNISLQPLLICQLYKNIQLFVGPRLQYRLPVYDQESSYYKGFHKNSLSLGQGKNDAFHLGFSLGINIF